MSSHYEVKVESNQPSAAASILTGGLADLVHDISCAPDYTAKVTDHDTGRVSSGSGDTRQEAINDAMSKTR